MLAILLSFGASETAEREALEGPHQPQPPGRSSIGAYE
jgi:hypothetical protein